MAIIKVPLTDTTTALNNIGNTAKKNKKELQDFQRELTKTAIAEGKFSQEGIDKFKQLDRNNINSTVSSSGIPQGRPNSGGGQSGSSVNQTRDGVFSSTANGLINGNANVSNVLDDTRDLVDRATSGLVRNYGSKLFNINSSNLSGMYNNLASHGISGSFRNVNTYAPFAKSQLSLNQVPYNRINPSIMDKTGFGELFGSSRGIDMASTLTTNQWRFSKGFPVGPASTAITLGVIAMIKSHEQGREDTASNYGLMNNKVYTFEEQQLLNTALGRRAENILGGSVGLPGFTIPSVPFVGDINIPSLSSQWFVDRAKQTIGGGHSVIDTANKLGRSGMERERLFQNSLSHNRDLTMSNGFGALSPTVLYARSTEFTGNLYDKATRGLVNPFAGMSAIDYLNPKKWGPGIMSFERSLWEKMFGAAPTIGGSMAAAALAGGSQGNAFLANMNKFQKLYMEKKDWYARQLGMNDTSDIVKDKAKKAVESTMTPGEHEAQKRWLEGEEAKGSFLKTYTRAERITANQVLEDKVENMRMNYFEQIGLSYQPRYVPRYNTIDPANMQANLDFIEGDH